VQPAREYAGEQTEHHAHGECRDQRTAAEPRRRPADILVVILATVRLVVIELVVIRLVVRELLAIGLVAIGCSRRGAAGSGGVVGGIRGAVVGDLGGGHSARS